MLRELEAAVAPANLKPAGWKKVREAYVLYREGIQKRPWRAVGLSFPDHGLEALHLAARMQLDADSLCATLLLQPFESDWIERERIEAALGEEVAFLCTALKNLPTFRFPSHAEAERMGVALRTEQAESFRKMLLAMARDIRVVLIRLCDRLQSLRTLEFIPAPLQPQIAQECRELYAPLANRLGISWLKNELEDLSLRFLFPKAFYELASKIDSTKREREKYIQEVQDVLHNLMQKHTIPCEIAGRSKHINSIYRKMVRGQLSFEQLYDILAFRVVCHTKDQCYQVLGVIHDRWKPIPGRFKDYIAMSKPNGYQSLHTTVLGPHNKKMEIQIRTHAMHKMAEEGIAAHWLYKEDKNPQARAVEQFRWLRDLLRLQDENEDADALLASVRDKLNEGDVFVFTPNGDVRELPLGATPVDFAFAIHTEVGNRCTGAKANGKIVPLRYKLETGDIVEILTHPATKPSRDWLKFVKTDRARSKIRNYLRTEQRERASTLGREILEKTLPPGHKNLNKLLKSGVLDPLYAELGAASVEELIMNIGYGKLDANELVQRLFPPEKQEAPPPPPAPRPPRHTKNRKDALLVNGMRDILIRYAGCCQPIPGDDVIGFISRGRGVIIHRTDCTKITDSDPARRIDVQWESSQKHVHSVSLRVVAENRPGLLSQLTKAFSDLQINISAAQCKTNGDTAINTFECQVNDLQHLHRLTDLLRQVKGVSQIQRLRD
jgi:GTP pyrophosphokinase